MNDCEIYFCSTSRRQLLQLCQTCLYLLHHLGVFLQLSLLLVDLCFRSFAYEFLVGQHAVYTCKLLGEALFLFLQALNLFGDINQLCKWHIDGCLRNYNGYCIIGNALLILL